MPLLKSSRLTPPTSYILGIFLLNLSLIGHAGIGTVSTFKAIKPYIDHKLIKESSIPKQVLSVQELKNSPQKALIKDVPTTAEQLKIYTDIFEQVHPNATSNDVQVDDSFTKKMEIFDTGTTNLFDIIDKTESATGSLQLACRLISPTADIPTLLTRQAAIKSILATPNLQHNLEYTLSNFAAQEAQLLTFY